MHIINYNAECRWGLLFDIQFNYAKFCIIYILIIFLFSKKKIFVGNFFYFKNIFSIFYKQNYFYIIFIINLILMRSYINFRFFMMLVSGRCMPCTGTGRQENGWRHTNATWWPSAATLTAAWNTSDVRILRERKAQE